MPANPEVLLMSLYNVSLLEGKKFREGKPCVHHFKTDTYREAYAHQLEIITDEITKHFYPTVPELYHDNRIREIQPPRRASDLRVIDTKRQDLSLARFLLPCGQRAETHLTEWAGRKTESTTTLTLLNEQTLTATAFPKYLRILVRDG